MAFRNYNNDSVETSDRAKTGWNISSQQSMHIFNLIQTATRNYLHGELHTWFWTLTALRENINYDLKPSERDELDKQEQKIKKIPFQEYLEEGTDLKKYKINRTNFTVEVRVYQRQIMDILKDLGYFPNKEDRTRLSF